MPTIAPPTLELSLLGPLQITHSAQGEIKENRRKVQALLVWLLLEADQTHSRDQLIALFWPEMDRAGGLQNLRVVLSRVRKHLVEPTALEATRADICLHSATTHQIDVLRFNQAIHQTETHDHLSLEACAQCQSNLHRALALYRGDFLAGFYLDENEVFHEWIFVWREQLHVRALTYMGLLADAEIANGRFAAAETLARRQIKLDLLRESAHRQLMRIFALRGDRSQALRQFQSCTEILAAELGVPPDEETVALKAQIEAEELKPEQQTPQKQSPQKQSVVINPRTLVAFSRELPETITPFFGRDEELAQLAARLVKKEYRLISLVGPGGIGKTRLSLQAGRQALPHFKDGAYFVPLVGLQSHHDMPSAVAAALGFLLALDGAPPADQIAHFLADKELLLIIDNLEHLMEGATILLDWVEKVPKLVLLVTSRERINAQSEDLFVLTGLPWPKDVHDPHAATYEAVRLFGDRAHRLHKQFSLNHETLPSVVKICQQVEGLPLALELAATVIREFDVAEIANALSREPALLATDLRDVPLRHRQFETVFEYSWQLLSATEQQTLARLSLFAGGFTPAAARAVTGAATTTLTHLRYKSLIRAEGNGRFTIHELLRQLAEKKLRLAGSKAVAETEAAHARYFLGWLQEKSPLLVGVDAAATAQALRTDIDNLRAAWQAACRRFDAPLLKQAVTAMVDFYVHIGLNFEMETLIQQVFSTYQKAGKPLAPEFDLLLKINRLDLISHFATVEQFESLYATLMAELNESTIADKALYTAKAHYDFAWVLAIGDDAKRAIAVCDAALALAKAVNDPVHLGYVLCLRAYYYYRFSQIDEALAALAAATQIFEPLGHLKGLSRVEERLAPAYAENGNYWKSLVHDKRALAIFEALGFAIKIPKGHQGVAFRYILLGAYDLARWHFQQAIALDERVGNQGGIMGSLGGLAEIEFLTGNYVEASRLYAQCLAYRRKDHDYQRFCFEAVDATRLLWRRGELQAAQRLNAEVIQWLIKFENRTELQMAQATQAMLLWDLGERARALQIGEALLATIDPYTLTEPIKTLFELFYLFSQANHPAAEIVIQQTHGVLQHLVKEVIDPEIVHSFLHNVPYCVWLREGFAQYQLGDIGAPEQN